MRYAAAPPSMTQVKPNDSARTVARIALTTDVDPFTAHAQGTSAGACPPSIRIARGNGTPIATPSGASSATLRASLPTSGSPSVASKSSGNPKA